jgi:hypothetical protein
MKTTTRTLLALTVAAALAAVGCSDDSNDQAAADDETVSKTIEVAIDGTAGDPADRIFAVTYFYAPDLDAQGLADALAALYDPEGTGEPPEGMVMGVAGMCGPDGWADAVTEATGFTVEPNTDQPCADDDAPFSTTLELPAGTALHYSVDAALLSDLENTDTFAGNHQGDPMDPPTAEDVEIVDADDTTTFTYPVPTDG